MFDPQGEGSFIESFRSATQDRSVILITHRPASLALADRILRLENGRLLEVSSERLIDDNTIAFDRV